MGEREREREVGGSLLLLQKRRVSYYPEGKHVSHLQLCNVTAASLFGVVNVYGSFFSVVFTHLGFQTVLWMFIQGN